MKGFAVCESCGSMNRYDAGKSDQAVCGRCKKNLGVHHGVIDVNAEGLQKLLDSCPLPVVVDFWAPWCGPCRQFAPTFQGVAQRKLGKAVFVKLNTEANPGAGQTHNVRGIPTLVVFADHKEKARISGALPPQPFEKWLGDAGI